MNHLKQTFDGLNRPHRHEAMLDGSPNVQGNPSAIDANSLTERLYKEIIAVMTRTGQINSEDYDWSLINTQILLPVAHYLIQVNSSKPGLEHGRASQLRHGNESSWVEPIFISGEPGIGKTTLMMALDEALAHLPLASAAGGSCRNLVIGAIHGYFADKSALSVTPLKLAGFSTAVLSARDWNNILRYWTFDEMQGKENPDALADLVKHLFGRVVIVDEAEIEGYVYFTQLLAERGILVLISSNLHHDLIRLPVGRFQAVTLTGIDHRHGDLSKVCVPQNSPELFALFSNHVDQDVLKSRLLADSKVLVKSLNGKSLFCLDWDDLRNRPLMKDDFAHFFNDRRPDMVLIDAVPFFNDLTAPDVNLIFLGQLSRFVNFVDAIHDCQLPLIVRGTHQGLVDAQSLGRQFKAALSAYDTRTGGSYGQTALIEWSRCLSRLKSREAFNAPLYALAQNR